MRKNLFLAFILISGLAAARPAFLSASCVEVSISTCVGDFANGGDYESAGRLLGNASWYGFGILQGNLVRVYIASGIPAGYDYTHSTPTRAGFIGIAMDGVSQQPQYHLDVWGMIRSTAGAYFATSTGSVGIGTTNPAYKLDVNGDVRVGTITASRYQFTDGSVMGSASRSVYDVVIGTPGATNVTVTTNTSGGLGAVIAQYCGAANVKVCPVGLSIGFQSGSFLFQDSTIPANVTVEAINGSSSTIWNMGAGTAPAVTVYGILRGVTLDAGGKVVNAPVLDAKDGALIENIRILNVSSITQNTNGGAINVVQSTNVTLNRVEIKNYTGIVGVNYTGDRGLIRIYGSTNVVFNELKISSMVVTANLGSQANACTISVAQSKQVFIRNGNFRNTGKYLLAISEGNQDVWFERNLVQVDTVSPSGATGGLITVVSDRTGGISTSSGGIINNIFLYEVASNSDIINMQTAGSEKVDGWLIDGNVLRYLGTAGAPSFLVIRDSGVRGTVVRDNRTYSVPTFISDTGTSTSYTTLGNFKDWTQQ